MAKLLSDPVHKKSNLPLVYFKIGKLLVVSILTMFHITLERYMAYCWTSAFSISQLNIVPKEMKTSIHFLSFAIYCVNCFPAPIEAFKSDKLHFSCVLSVLKIGLKRVSIIEYKERMSLRRKLVKSQGFSRALSFSLCLIHLVLLFHYPRSHLFYIINLLELMSDRWLDFVTVINDKN